MNELYFTEAVVLDRDESNDFDSRFSIYAKGYGKFFAKAKSARKILSKLSGHMEPGSLVKIRLVGNGGLQVADALKYGKSSVFATDLYLLNKILAEADFDFEIWEMLLGSPSTDLSPKFTWAKALRILGWDPDLATCYKCESKPAVFDIADQVFMCGSCSQSFLDRGGLDNFKRRSELIKLSA